MSWRGRSWRDMWRVGKINSSCRFNSSLPFIASFLSFHLFPTMRYFRPLVSSFLYPVRFFFPFVSTLPCRLLRPSFWFNSSCVVSTFPFRSLRPFFHSSLLFHLLLPFFRINSYVLFVSFFLPFQLFLSIRCVCAYVFLSFQFFSSICYFLSFA